MRETAVIFDLDGTLWDSCETIAPAWSRVCAGRGIDRTFTPDECRGYCGKTLEEIAALVFPDRPEEWRNAVLKACCAAENEPLSRVGGRLYPGLEAVLTKLRRNHFTAVVSNCQEGYIEAFFTGNRTARFFDDSENAERTGLTKGGNIRLVMARNGVGRAVYVGDTEGDRRAAEEAGIPFIHAAYGFGRVSSADAVIQSLEGLPAAVRALLL